jgi:hypothetical protein
LINLAKRNVPSRDLLKKVDTYIRMRDLKKAGNVTDDDLLRDISEGDEAIEKDTSKEKGYKKFIGKGSLDQRLRAIIAYKRESTVMEAAISGLSKVEDAELEQMMEDDDE